MRLSRGQQNGECNMIFEKVTLGVGKAELFIYKPDRVSTKEAMLVIPGGGYGTVCTDREGEPIALAYLAKGITSFVLHYSVGKDAPVNVPLVEASAAIAYIRRNAERFAIDPEKIYAVGFSAGGHLCCSLGTLWHKAGIAEKAGITYGENCPNGVVLCYPVISGVSYPHLGSFRNLIGGAEPSKEQLEEWSLELHVDDKSAPAFIIHTAEDRLVPVQNALCIATAYANAKRPFELHVYPHGDHGFALATEVTSGGNTAFEDARYARWVDESMTFFRSL